MSTNASASPSAPRVRIGVIGTGQIGQQHLKIYSTIPQAEVVAVADIFTDGARAAAAPYGIETVYANYEELLARDDIDAVDVCLHNRLHAPVTIAALRAGKNVYCEKPIAAGYADGAAMLAAAQETGKKLSIQLAGLYTDEVRAARELIDAGELGELYHARSAGFRRRGRPFVDGYGAPAFVQTAQAGGGALFDMGVYHISTMLYLLGNPTIERISGKTHQKIAMDETRRQSSGYDVEELAIGLVHCAGGITLDLVEAWAVHLDDLGNSFVLGSEGGIKLDPFGFFRNIGDLSLSASANLETARFRWNTLRGGDVYANSQAHWVAALQGRVELLPTAALALNTMLVSEGIYRSNEWGREVRAAEITG